MKTLRQGGGTATYHAIMAWAASLTVHLVLASAGAVLAASSPAPGLGFREIVRRRVAPLDERVIELPSLSAPAVERGTDRPSAEEPSAGGEAMPRPDSGHAGRGGDDTARAPAINLAARDDEAHLTPLLQSRLDRAQHARHREGDGRRSPEDDTVNEQPMMLTLFVDGSGTRAEQRPYARFDPGAGSLTGGLPRTRGGLHARPLHPSGVGLRPRDASAKGNGDEDAAPGGVLDSWWNAHSGYAANVMHARPFALRGLTASSADERGEHADTADAEQEDTTAERSLLHASTAGGPAGNGKGGEEGPGPTGSGGEEGAGSRARALGAGSGDGAALDAGDRRRSLYRRRVWAKIHGAWSARDFPKQAVLEGKQGYTIVSFTILASGAVVGISTTRKSGFPSFDAKMRAAVMRAAPFGPLPPELGPALPMRHEFIVSNAAVR